MRITFLCHWVCITPCVPVGIYLSISILPEWNNPCHKGISKQINQESPVLEHSFICTMPLRQQKIWGTSQSPLGCLKECSVGCLQTKVPSFGNVIWCHVSPPFLCITPYTIHETCTWLCRARDKSSVGSS